MLLDFHQSLYTQNYLISATKSADHIYEYHHIQSLSKMTPTFYFLSSPICPDRRILASVIMLSSQVDSEVIPSSVIRISFCIRFDGLPCTNSSWYRPSRVVTSEADIEFPETSSLGS